MLILQLLDVLQGIDVSEVDEVNGGPFVKRRYIVCDSFKKGRMGMDHGEEVPSWGLS